MSVAIKIDNTVATETIESEVKSVMTDINKPSERVNMLDAIARTETAARAAYWARLNECDIVGTKIGKSRADKILRRNVPTELDAFIAWAEGH